MKSDNLINEIAIRFGVKKFILYILACSITVNLILAIGLTTKGTIVQNILTPPEIRRSLTVSNVAFSKEYLEEMAPYAAFLLLNATPQTIEYQNSQLLKMTAPEYKDALEKELGVNALWLKRNNVSTYFTSLSAAADTTDNTVILKGLFEVKKNNLVVESKDRELLIEFRNNYGTLQLLAIKEVIKEKQENDKLNSPDKKELVQEDVVITNSVSEFKGGGSNDGSENPNQ